MAEFMDDITHQQNLSEEWPQWFRENQVAAWERFLEHPQPTKHDELWRFSNLKKASLSHFHVAAAPSDPDALIARSKGIPEYSAKCIFANDRLIYSESTALPEGVLLLSLAQAAHDHEALFRKYFMRHESRLGSLKFAMLHQAQLQTGIFLYVPAGVRIEKPIELWHWVEGEHSATFPHTLVICGKGSHVSVVDRFSSVKKEPALACALNDLILEEGAHLNYVSVQEWSDEATAFHLNSTEVETQGVATALQLNLGGHLVRTESDSRLLGKEAHSMMLSINSAKDHQEIDQRTYQDHSAPNATSDLLYHNVLNDHSRTIFSGLIKVGTEAHQTDAYQKVRNLMLSEEAEANSMPGLEILADDVRCTHGATSGDLNKDELFYMMARGIPPKMGAQLMVRGFFQTVLERLKELSLQQYLGELLDQRLQ